MKEIIALEELIETNEKRVSLFRRQVLEHESEENKLTPMLLASTESNLTEAILIKHKAMLDELLQKDLKELEKEEAIIRKNYYHFQNVRIKRNKIKSKDDEIFDIAEKSISLNLREHDNLYDKLELINNYKIANF